MNIYVAGMLGFVIGSVVTWVVAEIDRAPEGWQDSDGYHAGRQPMPDDTETSGEWAEVQHGDV